MYDPKSFETCLSALRYNSSCSTHEVMVVLVDGLEESVVNVAVAKHTRLDSLESLGELACQILITCLRCLTDLRRPLGQGSGLV